MKKKFFILILVILSSALLSDELIQGSIDLQIGYNYFNKENIYKNSGIIYSSYMNIYGYTSKIRYEGMHRVYSIKEDSGRKARFDIIKYSINTKRHNFILGDNNLFYNATGLNNTRLRGITYKPDVFKNIDMDIFAGTVNRPEIINFFSGETEYDRYLTGFNLNYKYALNNLNFTFYHSEDDPSTKDDLLVSLPPIRNTLFAFSNYYDLNEQIDLSIDYAYSIFDSDKKRSAAETEKSDALNIKMKYVYTENMHFDFNYIAEDDFFFSHSNRDLRCGRKGFFSDGIYYGNNNIFTASLNMYSDKSNDLSEKNKYLDFNISNKTFFIRNRILTFDYRFLQNEYDYSDTEYESNSFGLSMKDNIRTATVVYSFNYITASDKSKNILSDDNSEIYNLSLYLRDYIFDNKLYYNIYLLSSTKSSSNYRENYFINNFNIYYYLYENRLLLKFMNEYKFRKKYTERKKTIINNIVLDYSLNRYETLSLEFMNNYMTDKTSENFFNINIKYEMIF